MKSLKCLFSAIGKAADRVFKSKDKSWMLIKIRSDFSVWSPMIIDFVNTFFCTSVSQATKGINEKVKKYEFLGCCKSISIFCEDSSDQGAFIMKHILSKSLFFRLKNIDV